MGNETHCLLTASVMCKSADVAEEMKATWQRKRGAMQQQEQPSFQPALTARGRLRVGRTPEELSEGDRLRQEFHKAITPSPFSVLAVLAPSALLLTFGECLHTCAPVKCKYVSLTVLAIIMALRLGVRHHQRVNGPPLIPGGGCRSACGWISC